MQNGYNHNLLKVLRTFNKQEIKNFRKFINSPYFNEHKTVLKLSNELLKYYPLFESNKISKDVLLSIASPNKNESTLRDAMSMLYRATIDFISYENFRKDKNTFRLNALRGISEKNIHEIFDKILAESESESGKLKSESYVKYSLNKFQLRQIQYDEYQMSKDNRKGAENDISTQKEIFINLANHFILQSFRTYYDISTYVNIIDLDPDELPVGKMINSNAFSEIMQIARNSDGIGYMYDIYSALYEMKVKNKEGAYTKYKELIRKNSKNLSRDELVFHNLELIDHCIKKDHNNFDDLYHATELFGHYTYLLDTKLYKYVSDNSVLIPTLYLNILINAVKLKKIKWLEKFISEHLNEVPESDKNNLEQLSYAILYNSINEFSKSQQYAFNIKEKNKIDLKIRRALIIRNYTELKMHEEALKEITNFRGVIKRTKLLTNNEKQKLNKFLKCAENIALAETGSPKTDRDMIKTEINELKESWFYKSWLLKKSGELLNK